jgi:hypothetical protein
LDFDKIRYITITNPGEGWIVIENVPIREYKDINIRIQKDFSVSKI